MKINDIESKTGLLVSGGVVASMIASICCIGPLILTILGISGGAVLAKLEVVRIPMMISVLVLFSVAGFSLYRKRNRCEPGSVCANPKKYRKMVVFYWLGLVVAVLEITSPRWVTWLFS